MIKIIIERRIDGYDVNAVYKVSGAFSSEGELKTTVAHYALERMIGSDGLAELSELIADNPLFIKISKQVYTEIMANITTTGKPPKSPEILQ